jgi:hypothetical protein
MREGKRGGFAYLAYFGGSRSNLYVEVNVWKENSPLETLFQSGYGVAAGVGLVEGLGLALELGSGLKSGVGDGPASMTGDAEGIRPEVSGVSTTP